MKTAIEYFEEAESFRSKEQFEKAVESYRKAIEKDPLFLDALNNLGFTLRESGAVDEAIPYFEKCIEINPTYNLGYKNLGICYQDKDWKKSIEYLEKYIKNEPDSPDLFIIYNSIGVAYFQQEEYQLAEENYLKCLELKPQNDLAYFNLGLVYWKLENLEKAADYFQKTIDSNPNYQSAYLNLGKILLEKSPEKAKLNFEKYIELSPDKMASLNCLNDIGIIYFNQEQYETAIDFYEKCIDLDKNFELALFNNGLAYWRLENLEKAADYFQKTIDSNPNYQNAYLNLGKILLEKSPEKAKLNFEKYIELNPDNINIINEIGNIYFDKKLYPAAIDFYEKCIELDKKYEFAYFNIGLCHESTDTDKAISFFEKANQANPKWHKPFFKIASVFQNKNQLDKAINYFEKSHELNPKDWEPLYQIAICYQPHDIKNSKKYLHKAIAADPSHSDSHVELGRLALMEGDLETSRKHSSKSIEIQPDSKWAHYNFAFSYMKTDPLKAIEYFEKTIEIDPTYFDAYNNIYFSIAALEDKKAPTEKFINFVEEKNNAHGYWALGNLYQYSLLDFPEALINYEKSNAIAYNNELALDISNLYEMMNDYEKSIEVLDEALEKQEDFIYAMHNKAHFLFNMGRYSESRDVWKNVAHHYEEKFKTDQFFNASSNNYLYLGTIYREIFEHFEKAEAILSQGIKLDPSNFALLVAINQVYVDIQNKSIKPDIKNFWKRNANLQKAERLFKPTLKIEDDYFNMGELYFVEEKNDKAISVINEFLEKEKPSVRLLTLKGLIQISSEKYREAIQSFKDAQRLAGQNLSLMTNLAFAHFKNKEHSKAENIYLKTLRIDPNNVDALNGLGEINLERAEDSSSSDLLDVAEKYFKDALKKGKSEAGSIRLNIHELKASNSERKYKDLKLSDLYYSLGYIKTKQFEKDKISLNSSSLNDGLRYFTKSFEANPDNYKAKAAKEQILKFSKTTKKTSTSERLGAGLISIMALLLFVLAQYFFFFRNNTSTEFSLGKENSTFLQSTLPIDSLQGSKLKSLAEVNFKSKSSLLQAIGEITGQSNLSEMGMLSSLTFSKTSSDKDGNKLTPGFFALISFGSLIFLIAGLYLPKLLKLKVGVIEIEKNAPTEAKTVSFLGIQK